MKVLLYRSVLYVFLLFFILEFIVRIFHLVNEIPKRRVNSYGIQQYMPNQRGKWNYGEHEWIINEYGWPGERPKKMQNLITLIGDSHIENFMNPNKCHLNSLLSKKNKAYNFFEAGRSGASLIEMLEFSKFLSLKFNPKYHFLFVKDSDITESIVEHGKREDISQLSIIDQKIYRSKIKNQRLKNFLYNVKSAFYIYRSLERKNSITNSIKHRNDKQQKRNKSNISKLFEYVATNYNLENVVFFVHPNSSIDLTYQLKRLNLKFYEFKAKDQVKWQSSKDDYAHWSCYGFKQASKQVLSYLDNLKNH